MTQIKKEGLTQKQGVIERDKEKESVETEKPGGDGMKGWARREVRQDGGGKGGSTEEEESRKHFTKWRRISCTHRHPWAALGIVKRSTLNNRVKVPPALSQNDSSFNMVRHTRAVNSRKSYKTHQTCNSPKHQSS